jgi:hypothetical protein
MSQPECDVCGKTEGVECEILLKGESVDRIYHLCPEHWIEVYRKTLEDFLEANEYKCNLYIKMAVDKLISDSTTEAKIEVYSDEEGMVDVARLNPTALRKIRPYEEEEGLGDE